MHGSRFPDFDPENSAHRGVTPSPGPSVSTAGNSPAPEVSRLRRVTLDGCTTHGCGPAPDSHRLPLAGSTTACSALRTLPRLPGNSPDDSDGRPVLLFFLNGEFGGRISLETFIRDGNVAPHRPSEGARLQAGLRATDGIEPAAQSGGNRVVSFFSGQRLGRICDVAGTRGCVTILLTRQIRVPQQSLDARARSVLNSCRALASSIRLSPVVFLAIEIPSLSHTKFVLRRQGHPARTCRQAGRRAGGRARPIARRRHSDGAAPNPGAGKWQVYPFG